MTVENELGILVPTVVGSYPAHSVDEAVTAQLDAGIECISTGQICCLGKGMSEPFVPAMRGLEMQQIYNIRVPIIGNSRIAPLAKDELMKTEVVEEVRRAHQESQIRKKEGVHIKGIITGPNTILYEIPPFGLGYYRGRTQTNVLTHIADCLLEIAEAMLEAGADVIQIDEPIFSRFPELSPEQTSAVVSIARNLKVRPKLVVLHVCGKITRPLFKLLVQLDGIDVLDHEFAAMAKGLRENLKTIDPELLKQYQKGIGLGVIDNSSTVVESVSQVKALIKEGIEKFGAENLMIDPDCGLRRLRPDIARRKLEVMVQAINEVKQELGL